MLTTTFIPILVSLEKKNFESFIKILLRNMDYLMERIKKKSK